MREKRVAECAQWALSLCHGPNTSRKVGQRQRGGVRRLPATLMSRVDDPLCEWIKLRIATIGWFLRLNDSIPCRRDRIGRQRGFGMLPDRQKLRLCRDHILSV